MACILEQTSLSGAYATRLLAEAGHEVIRLESREGDDVRRMGPFLRGKADLEHGVFHQFLNAGKRSLSVDLDHALGKEIFASLLRTTDAVVTSSLSPIRDQSLLQANSNLVVIKIDEEKSELCAFARSGLLSLTGQPGEEPRLLGGQVSFTAAGLYAASATILALLQRKLTGRGQTVTVSAMQCLESFMEQAMLDYTFTGAGTERKGNRGRITALSGALKCKDGHFVISQISGRENWARFVDWVQDPVLSKDRSLAEEEKQETSQDLILDRVENWASQFNKSELVEEAQRRRMPASPVSAPLDLVRDPQLRARGFLSEMEHPQLGRIAFPQGAIASTLGNKVTPAPTLGQHNQEILGELGYSDSEVEFFIENGAL
jgi:crotonobetainyl-CoA:carnitine CoA-transferase CaiB-like acyl-CoA transferase